jgi:hypothetical protein
LVFELGFVWCANSNNVELIKKYKQLLDDGVITKEEFEQKKKRTTIIKRYYGGCLYITSAEANAAAYKHTPKFHFYDFNKILTFRYCFRNKCVI